jgi:hypothetical protein
MRFDCSNRQDKIESYTLRLGIRSAWVAPRNHRSGKIKGLGCRHAAERGRAGDGASALRSATGYDPAPDAYR